MFQTKECGDIHDIDLFIKNILINSIQKKSLSIDSLILIKPNCNSDMIALTGNTTDLRIIVSIIRRLKDLGYENIIIGDGTSSGFVNSHIDVLSRLGIKRLSEIFKIKYIDFNEAEFTDVPFLDTSIRIAKVCLDADFFVNISKLKTHAEAQMSACLKNMIGCVVGKDKQKVHTSLAEGIFALNKILKPTLHFVDTLISMEGTGPSRGIPKLTNILAVGDNPFYIDSFFAEFMGIGYKNVGYLELAEKEGLIDERELNISEIPHHNFLMPKPSLLFKLINRGPYRKFFAYVRYLPIIQEIISSSLLAFPLYISGARQDIFIKEDDSIDEIYVDENLCTNCKLCTKYCPLEIDIPSRKKLFPGCIKCFYCYFICPYQAIKIKGKPGYLKYQINYYRQLIFERIVRNEGMFGNRISA